MISSSGSTAYWTLKMWRITPHTLRFVMVSRFPPGDPDGGGKEILEACLPTSPPAQKQNTGSPNSSYIGRMCYMHGHVCVCAMSQSSHIRANSKCRKYTDRRRETRCSGGHRNKLHKHILGDLPETTCAEAGRTLSKKKSWAVVGPTSACFGRCWPCGQPIVATPDIRPITNLPSWPNTSRQLQTCQVRPCYDPGSASDLLSAFSAQVRIGRHRRRPNVWCTFVSVSPPARNQCFGNVPCTSDSVSVAVLAHAWPTFVLSSAIMRPIWDKLDQTWP